MLANGVGYVMTGPRIREILMLESMGTHRIIFENRGTVIGKGLDLERLMV